MESLWYNIREIVYDGAQRASIQKNLLFLTR